jgi:hypothetical protein
MMDKIAEFVKLEQRKADLQAELNQVKKDLQILEPIVRNHMLDNNIKSMNVDGRTAYLKKNVFIKLLVEKPVVAQALMDAGLTDFVREDFNIRTLTAYCREMLENKTALPSQLANKIKIDTKISLKSRKA